MVVTLRAEKKKWMVEVAVLQDKIIGLLGERVESLKARGAQLEKCAMHSKKTKKFKKLMSDPNTSWKVIEGGKGGAL